MADSPRKCKNQCTNIKYITVGSCAELNPGFQIVDQVVFEIQVLPCQLIRFKRDSLIQYNPTQCTLNFAS